MEESIVMQKQVKLVCGTLLLGALIGIGAGNANGHHVYAADISAQVPQKVNVAKTTEAYSYATGKRTFDGHHRLQEIHEAGTGQYLFCVQWSKVAPSNQEIMKKTEANPAVEWLVNDFYRGAGKRSQSIGSEDGDYWLYQSVIHWITGGKGLGGAPNIDYWLDHGEINTTVANKLKALHAKALSVTNNNQSRFVTNSHSLNFNPNKLTINPNGDAPVNGFYQGNIKFSSNNVNGVKVTMEGQPSGTKLEGGNLNNLANGTNLSVKVPMSQNKPANFKVKATGTWDKSSKVVWIYGDAGNVKQNVTHVSAVTTPVQVSTEAQLNVIVRDHFNLKVSKKAFNGQGLAGSQFVLIRRPAGTKDLNITPDQAKKEAYRKVGDELVLGHSDQAPFIGTTDNNGNLYFDKVKYDDPSTSYDYYGIEVKAPNGYSLSSTPVKFERINVEAPKEVSATIQDSTQPMPETGSKRLLKVGITAVGLAFLGAGSTLVLRRKKQGDH